ncbi:MAG: hypothetical protein ACPG32_01310 [Akkermansiaceae bacterium]
MTTFTYPSPVELANARLTSKVARNLTLCLFIGAMAGYIIEIATEIPLFWALDTWYVPLISVATVCWMPWLMQKLSPVASIEKLLAFCALNALIGYDLMRRVADGFYYIDRYGC